MERGCLSLEADTVMFKIKSLGEGGRGKKPKQQNQTHVRIKGFHTTQYQKRKRNTLNAQTGGKLSPQPIVTGPSGSDQVSSHLLSQGYLQRR